ncbi:MAG: hypothetical protein QG640_642 [Patescibacteria group bacterium]|nr:hypothetical protein [Patescibacteria group bacterium]
MKRVTLVGRDIAPSQALRALAEKLRQQECCAGLYVGDGKPLPASLDEIALAALGSNLVIVGMSSSEALAREELHVAELAKRKGIPLVLYADTFGVHGRPWFEHLMAGSTLFHINGSEAEKAVEMFPKTDVVVTGNPMWEEFFYPRLTREKARERIGAAEGQKVILCPGGKLAATNIVHFASAIETFASFGNVLIAITLHPADKTSPEVYDGLLSLSPVPTKIIAGAVISGPDMLPGVDVLFDSASTLGIEAVCLRVPVVHNLSFIAECRLKQMTGNAIWPLCEEGVVIDLTDTAFRYEAISELLKHPERTYANCLRNAEALYPVPKEKGLALTKMMAAIERLLAS